VKEPLDLKMLVGPNPVLGELVIAQGKTLNARLVLPSELPGLVGQVDLELQSRT